MKSLIYVLTTILMISCTRKEEKDTNKNADSTITETKTIVNNQVKTIIIKEIAIKSNYVLRLNIIL